jgi:flagellar basal body-associated protein FliL
MYKLGEENLRKKIVFISLFIVLFIVALIGYGVYWAFFDMSSLPKGDKIAEVSSTNGTYTIKAYVTSGGATTDNAILGELNFNKANRKPKNIYWNYHEETANIKWIDDNTVIINGHKLKVPNQTFDFRR